MNKGFFKRLAAGAVTAMLAFMSFTTVPNVPSASAANVGDKLSVGNGMNQHKGNCDGYSYEVWIDSTGGNGSMTLGTGASFKAEWSANVSSGNFLARRGLDFGSQKKATDYPYIGMDYEADYRQTGSANGNSRLCVYGWFQNKGAGNVPLVEYYIIEDWVDWCPDGNGKMVTIDDAQYKIFQLDHTGPTINGGSETFKQYFSVRQDKRTSGHITVSDHFKAWADQGWGIGNLYEVALNAEGWQSSGVADVKMLDVYTDPSQAGNGGEIIPPTPVEPDENGHYFHSTFESDEDGWTGRGAASVQIVNGGAEGSKALSVTGRTDTWNGVSKSLSTSVFKPGESYAFSAMAKQDASASEDFKLTLECSVDGEKQYLDVASNTGAKGEWVQLSNPSFTIPEGASGLVLYVETIDTTTSFTVDEMIGGVKDSVKEPVKKAKLGDINGDGKVDSKDLPLLQDYLLKRTTTIDGEAADMDKDGVLTCFDMVLLRKAVAAPVIEPVTQSPQSPTESTPNGGADPSEFMASVRSSFTTSVPSNVQSGDQGKTERISYSSKVAGVNKGANVWLPPGYDSSKKYNVLYMNHGVFGNEDSMLTGFSVREMASNLISSGEAEPFIIVFPQMYSGPGGGTPSFAQMNMDTMDNYDKFLQDMTESLMPYIESHYSVKTGRDNTAIAGFSMGGRETLYLTISRPDLFGYACSSSPAPGIVPASDSFIANHLGSYKADGQRMTNADFKIDKDKMPYLLMIGGGTADGVVGTFPESYHNLFTQNGTDHIWQSFPGGGHDGSVGTPMFYNFFKNVFKATK